MSEDINEDKVTLSYDLLLLIFSFIRIPFHNNIPLSLLFNYTDEYIQKKYIHNIYCDFSNSCKSFYSEKYKDSYIIFNKEYSKKYNESKEFREEVSKKIDIKNLLIYSNKSITGTFIFPDIFTTFNYDTLINCSGEEVLFKNRPIIYEEVPYKEIFAFMKLEYTDVTKISKNDILKQIIAFVNKEKHANNPYIFVEGDCTRFRLIGDLKTLFDFIKKQMILRGDLENPEEFPEHTSYFEILKYLKYCFPVKITNNV
jgi:hypothetical protein